MADTKRLITIQRVAANGTDYDIYYPRTVASQVFYDEGNNLTVADHITDAAQIHLTAAERTAMTNYNQANGFAKLDANGFVPTANINPAVLAITKEFDTVAALLTAAAAADFDANVAQGQLVWVNNATGDGTVSSGWAVYRRKVQTNPASYDYTKLAPFVAATGTYVDGTTYYTDASGQTVVDSSSFVPGTTDVSSYFVADATVGWTKVAEAESLDVVVNWANIVGKPNSTPAQIDQAVADDHTHSNKAALDQLADATTGDAPNEVIGLNYKGRAIAFDDQVTTFTLVEYGQSTPAASTLDVGDFVFVETSAST